MIRLTAYPFWCRFATLLRCCATLPSTVLVVSSLPDLVLLPANEEARAEPAFFSQVLKDSRGPRLCRGPGCDHGQTLACAVLPGQLNCSLGRLTLNIKCPSKLADSITVTYYAPPELSRPQLSDIKATFVLHNGRRYAGVPS